MKYAKSLLLAVAFSGALSLNAMNQQPKQLEDLFASLTLANVLSPDKKLSICKELAVYWSKAVEEYLSNLSGNQNEYNAFLQTMEAFYEPEFIQGRKLVGPIYDDALSKQIAEFVKIMLSTGKKLSSEQDSLRDKLKTDCLLSETSFSRIFLTHGVLFVRIAGGILATSKEKVVSLEKASEEAVQHMLTRTPEIVTLSPTKAAKSRQVRKRAESDNEEPSRHRTFQSSTQHAE